jgi:adenosylcobinamide-GDP ribazoletransferase
MRDSRVGSFGVVGVCCLLLLKFTSLTALAGPVRTAALVLAPVLSRWAMVYALSAYPYARAEGGKGTAFRQEARWWRLALATLAALVCAAALFGPAGLALLLGTWLVTVALSSYIKSRLGGLSGDSYGAVNEVVEVAALALAPLAPRWLPTVGGLPFV